MTVPQKTYSENRQLSEGNTNKQAVPVVEIEETSLKNKQLYY